MGKGMDWVPCYRWGARQTAPINTQLDAPLFLPTQYDGPEVVGRIDDSPGRYFIHRIIGMISHNWSGVDPDDGLIHECLWPGIIDDFAVGSVSSTGFCDEGTGANADLWWRRTKWTQSSTNFDDMSEVSEPWFNSVDIKPRRVIEDGQIPLYSMFNNDTILTLDVYLWLRLLVTPLE